MQDRLNQDNIIAWKHGLTLHPGVILTTSLVFHFIIRMRENNLFTVLSIRKHHFYSSDRCFERLLKPSGIRFIVELIQTSRHIETGQQPVTGVSPTVYFFLHYFMTVVLSTNSAAESVQIGHTGRERREILSIVTASVLTQTSTHTHTAES